MKRLAAWRLTAMAALLMLAGCGGGKSDGGGNAATASAKDSTIVISTLGDVDNLNPVIAQSTTSANVIGMTFPSLMFNQFDTAVGTLRYVTSPNAIAKAYKISDDRKSITYTLRSDVKWNDGTPFTSKDFKFSYELYGDTVIASVRQQYLAEFVGVDTKGFPDFDKAVQAPDDTTLTFNFYKPLSDNALFFRTGLTAVPKHVWEKVPRNEVRTSEFNSKPPTTMGIYKLLEWKRQQEIILASEPLCNLPKPGNTPRIVFRIIPDYTVRLTQLKTQAIDLLETMKPEDAKNLVKENAPVKIKPVSGRAYDYIGWMNIDNKAYTESKGEVIKPHPLFGSKKVRQALTTAIDRQAILDGFLGEYGKEMVAPIAPLFKWAYDNDLKPYPFNREKAAKMLDEEGWKIGNDGVREKDGKKFSFSLFINAGNARRNYAATVVQGNLKEVGIDCKIEQAESNVFFDKIRKKEYDAYLAGFQVGLELTMKDSWGSDLKKSPFNGIGYQNKKVDALLAKAEDALPEKGETVPLKAVPFWKEFQEIIYEDQPQTFLYWITELHGLNKRVTGEEMTVLSALFNIDDWKLNPYSAMTAK